MRFRIYIVLFLLGLLSISIIASQQDSPGYMDADYYYAGGLQLVNGHGFYENILWNFLDDPQGLPHPSHAYWMPLSSILAAVGMGVFGVQQFETARLGFILTASLVPPLTAALSYSISARKEHAIFAGLIAVLPMFYLSYYPTTDIFGIYMVLGGSFILIVQVVGKKNTAKSIHQTITAVILGILAGMMHLARADGILWLLIAFFVCGWMSIRSTIHGSKILRFFLNTLLCVCGYLIIIGPWMLRNMSAFGGLFAPGGMRALWITSYDELFAYPGALLTPSHWWNNGLVNILQTRLWAAGQNLQTSVAVQGSVLLFPLIILGLWRERRAPGVVTGISAYLATFLLMTIVFPFQGARGGFFHSGTAIQPLLWAVVPIGLQVFIAWGNKIRGWDSSQAMRFFQVGIILLLFFTTALISYQRVVGVQDPVAEWNLGHYFYQGVEKVLLGEGASSDEVVLVNNPAGYFIATQRPAISIPYGDISATFAVAERYNGRYLILESDQILGGEDLYKQPGDRPGLLYLGNFHNVVIYSISRQ